MKNEIKKLRKKLIFERKNGWELEHDEKKVEEISRKYLNFLNSVKTEREFVKFAVEKCRENGFIDLREVKEWKKGLRVYFGNEKMLFLAYLEDNPESGFRITVSHIDSPRLDLKMHPLYEDESMALAKTHYYGGIKKYQWLNIPLEIRGVVVKDNGEIIDVKIGCDEKDPAFVVADLLPHLARKQMEKPMKEAVEGEALNVLLGGKPLKGKGKERVKLHILKILNEKYGIREEDFVSSELEIVPSIKARELGLDASMIGGYGQDDRIHAFLTLEAFLESKLKGNVIAAFFDREEIGSEGNSSARSRLFENFLSRLLDLYGIKENSALWKIFENSEVLSTDVRASLDPSYKDVHDLRNAPRMHFGPVIEKYTGWGGKYSASEASAEFVAKIRKMLNKNGIPWQSGGLGKVDEGGGGTVAKYFAERGCKVLDFGVSLLAMHSPYEISSKIDIYWMFKALNVFFEGK